MAGVGTGVQRMTQSWHNWSGSVQCGAVTLTTPASVDELSQQVRAHDGSGALRPIGSGHSFVPFWGERDTLLDMSHFNSVAQVASGLVRVGAGVPLHLLGPRLAELGVALANMGDIDRQTLAGAVATGTHGTGTELGSLSAQVRALELVDGRGEVRRLQDAEDVDLGRVSLGLLGVITTLDMSVMPRYGLHERNWREPVETALAAFDQRIREHRHHEFWWVPSADLALAKTLDRIAIPEQSRLDEIAFGEEGERWGESWQVFPSVRDLRFNEMEYAVPAEAGLECFRALRGVMLERFPKLPWPVEYRQVAGDAGWLSPTQGRPVATLSIHQDASRDPWPLFQAIEPVLREFGGRPHWGKCHSLGRTELQTRYPRMQAFVAQRRQFDPDGRFLTPYLAARFS